MNRILITLKYFMLQSFCFVSLSFFIFNSAHAQSLSEPSADALPPQVQGHRTESTTNIDTPIIFENIYHHHSDWHGAGAHDLQVEMKLIGGSVMGSVKFLSKNAVAPMSYNNGSPQYYIDALGSSNIELVINEEVGYAEYAASHF